MAPTPTGEVVTQLGFDLAVQYRDRRPLAGITLVVDSGTARQADYNLRNPLLNPDTVVVT